MAQQVTDYICPTCSGAMAFDAASGKVKCEYCGSAYEVEEIKALYADKNKAAVEQSKTATADVMWDAADGMKAYKCQACGAEMVCDDTTAATSCPYCGNPTVMPQQFTGMLKPKYVIPFKVDKNQAIDKLKEYYKGKKLLPNNFTRQNMIEEIKGVYVPFWLYSGTVEGDLSYEGRQTEEKKTATERIETTKHYDVRRKGTVAFEKIPTDASTIMPDDLMDSIEPYDYKDLKPFEMEYLPGYLADKYDVSKEDSLKRARNRAEASTIDAIGDTLDNYDSVSEKRSQRQIRYMSEKQEYALMPVWLLGTRWHNENCMFAMNGQTGEMTGNLPVDNGKRLAWILGVMLPIFALIMIAGGFASKAILGAAIVAIIAGFITNSILMGQMKPVRQKSMAGQYMQGGKNPVKLSIKEDTYVRTTVEKHPINQNNNASK